MTYKEWVIDVKMRESKFKRWCSTNGYPITNVNRVRWEKIYEREQKINKLLEDVNSN